MICDRHAIHMHRYTQSVKFSRVNGVPSTEALPEGALLCKYSKLCVLSPLLFIILSISISALKRLKRLLDLHIVDIQQQFTSVFFDLTATITIQMQFDCGGGEDRECSDWLGIISIIFYIKFCSSEARVVTLVKKMIQSSYWNFSIQLILMIYYCFYQMLS